MQTRHAFVSVFGLIPITRAIASIRPRFVRALATATALAAVAAAASAARAAEYTAVPLYPMPVPAGLTGIFNSAAAGQTVQTVADLNPLPPDAPDYAVLFLKPLGDYGGPTQTIALKQGSPALDYALTCSGSDQRGQKRPASCDSGSFER